MTFRTGALACAITLAAAVALPFGAAAQSYPDRPITIIVPYPPGASTDGTARAIQARMSERLGQPIVIENRGGSAGNIGTAHVIRSEPDGYTLVVTVNPPVSSNHLLFADYDIDPLNDFTPLGIIARTLMTLAVHPDLPIHTVEDLIEYARANPGEVHYGTAGIGSAHHIAGEIIALEAGIEYVHVPYQGGGPAVQDLMGGHIETAFGTMPAMMPQHEAGTVRIIALAENRRYEDVMPGMPIVPETIEGARMMETWVGLLGPAGLPDDVAATLTDALIWTLEQEDVRTLLSNQGLVPVGEGADALRAQIESDVALFTELFPAIGLGPQ